MAGGGITAASKQLLRAVLPSFSSGAGQRPGGDKQAVVLWFKAGHEVAQEAKTQIIDLFKTLATIDDSAAAAASAEVPEAAKPQQAQRASGTL